MTVQNNRKILFGFPFREYIKWMVEYFHIIDSVKGSIIPNLINKIQIFIWIPALLFLCIIKLLFAPLIVLFIGINYHPASGELLVFFFSVTKFFTTFLILLLLLLWIHKKKSQKKKLKKKDK